MLYNLHLDCGRAENNFECNTQHNYPTEIYSPCLKKKDNYFLILVWSKYIGFVMEYFEAQIIFLGFFSLSYFYSLAHQAGKWIYGLSFPSLWLLTDIFLCKTKCFCLCLLPSLTNMTSAGAFLHETTKTLVFLWGCWVPKWSLRKHKHRSTLVQQRLSLGGVSLF